MGQNKEFYIDQDGIKLHAKLDFPKSVKENDKLPLVLLVPGLTGHMEEAHIIAVAESVMEANMACLRVELYGHGKSDGAFENHNVLLWVSELIYVIDYAKNLDFVTDLYLAGHSQGGLTVMLVAALKADCLKAVLPLSPATVIKDSCIAGNLFGCSFDPHNIPENLVFWDNRLLSNNYVRVGKCLPIDEAIDAFSKEVFLLHGTEDETVPVSYGIEAANRYKKSKLVLIEGAGHCYDDHLDEVKEAVRNFLMELDGQNS